VRWAKPPSTFVPVEGMQVHVRDEGPRDAPTILLVHGTGNSLHTWDGWAARLRDSFRVVSFDRPGFGLTGPNPTGDYSMRFYVDFLRRLLDVVGIERAVIAGNSAGGRVAWQFAVAEPGRVAALVLLASAGYPRMTPRTFGFRLAMSPLGPLILRLASKTAVKRSIRRTYGDPSKVTQEVIDRSYDLMQAPGVRNALGATLRQLDASDESALIRTITVPTLILWGTNDAVVPYTDAERFHADIAGSTLVTLPGVGHLPQEEDPGATAASFRRFWDGIDQSAGASKVTS
jgi:pimeloyl-ACP methyl ester carboxylesterase